APRELGGSVDRVRASAREEDLAVRDGSERGEAVGEVEHGASREVAEDVVRVEPLELRRRRTGDLGATEADVRVPEAGGAVEVAATALVPDVAPLAAVDDELVPVDGAHVREPVPERR